MSMCLEALEIGFEVLSNYRPIRTEVDGITDLGWSAFAAITAVCCKIDSPRYKAEDLLKGAGLLAGVGLVKLTVPIMAYLSYSVYSVVDR